MQQATEYSLAPLYNLLNLDPTTNEQKIRAAYIYLCRLWHYKALPNWIIMGLDPNQPNNDSIYTNIDLINNRINQAFRILTHPDLREEYLNAQMSEAIRPLDNGLIEFKNRCESQYADYLLSKPKEKIEQDLFDSMLPDEIFLLIMRFLDNKSLARLARSGGIYNSKITKFALLWKRLIESRDKYKLYVYFSRCPLLLPNSLDVIFSLEIPAQKAEERLMPYSNMAERLADDAMNFAITPLMQRDGFRSTAAYFGYLMSNVKDFLITTRNDTTLMNPDHESLVVTDESGKTLKQLVTGNMSVFQVLTTILPYSENVYHNLAYMIQMGLQLPSPFKTRENFETTASYFEYLLCNVHDLFIAIHNNPKLINEQDENGQTLLFFPVIAAQYLSRNRVKWIMQILTSVPDIKLDTVDKNGNTCIHWTTRNCTNVFRNREGLACDFDHVIFDDVFLPLIDFAKKKKFNFESLDRNKMSVLHIAANLPEIKPNPVFTLLFSYKSNSNINPNQLSGEGCTALYYVIKQLKLDNMESLWRETDLNNPAGKKAIFLLQEIIFEKSQQALDCLKAVFTLFLKGFDFDMIHSFISSLSNALKYIRSLHNIFEQMVLKINGLPAKESYRPDDWLTESMVKKVLDKFKASSWYNNILLSNDVKQSADIVLKILNDANESIQTKSKELWDYVQFNSSQNTPLLNVILEVFKEEVEREIVLIHDDRLLGILAKDVVLEASKKEVEHEVVMEDSVPSKSAKDMGVDELKKLISVKLMQLKMISFAIITKELGDYFIKITSNIPMKDCNLLFEFLLTHRANTGNTSSLWQGSVNQHINWPVLIENIRAKALERLKSASGYMGYGQVIGYLKECRTFPIFNLPNSLAEKVGRTYAVVEIDNLIQQRECERSVNGSRALRK